MKPDQRRRYAERIERALRHLEDQAQQGATPGLSDLAETAAMSPFHFHRIFRLMTGETPAEVIRRVRLARSLPALADTRSVTAAAGESGYATPQAFARALKREIGLTPSDARDQGDEMANLSARLRAPALGGLPTPISVEVVSLKPIRLLAIRNIGDYAELNAGFTRLFEQVLEQVEPDQLQGIYGIPHDDPRFAPADECRFDCALAVGDQGAASGDLHELIIGDGTFARLRHFGNYDAIQETIDRLYLYAIEVFALEIARSPLFIHYLDDPEEVVEAELRSDIYLPLHLDAAS